MNADKAELMELVSAALDGQLDDASKARLESLLRHSEEMRQTYVRIITDSAGVAMAAKDRQRLDDVSHAPIPTRAVPTHRTKRTRWIAAAAAILITVGLTVAGVVWWNHSDVPPRVAIVSRALNAEWEGPGPAGQGSPMATGWWNLRRGTVDVRFNSGATVSFQGPSEFELRSPMETYCRSGRLVATVPAEAKGFCVASPVWRVVDLGTEFGLITGKQNEVHVFKGQVQVERNGEASLTVAEGDALSMGVDGQLKPMHADWHDFDEWPGRKPHGPPGPRISLSDIVLQSIAGDDEARKAVLKPRVEQWIAAKLAWYGNPMVWDGVMKSREDLLESLMARETPPDQLREKLEAFRAARKSAQQAIQEAEAALRAELTPREEAQLLLPMWIN